MSHPSYSNHITPAYPAAQSVCWYHTTYKFLHY